MNAEAWGIIRSHFGSGQITLLEYEEVTNKRFEPIIVGSAPLDAPEDSERWRITHLYYGDNSIDFQVVKIREIEHQLKWSERLASR